MFLSNSNGKIDVIGGIAYDRWFIRDSGENRDKQRMLASLSWVTVLAALTERGKQ